MTMTRDRIDELERQASGESSLSQIFAVNELAKIARTYALAERALEPQGGIETLDLTDNGMPWGKPKQQGQAQPVADERDAERLEWVSHAWGGQRHDYANHVLSRGGDGDLSDIRTFIDKHLPARAALCQPADEAGKA